MSYPKNIPIPNPTSIFLNGISKFLFFLSEKSKPCPQLIVFTPPLLPPIACIMKRHSRLTNTITTSTSTNTPLSFMLHLRNMHITNLKPQTVHNGYKGLDLKIHYNLENDTHVVFCDTYTQGSYELFVMVNSVVPILLNPKQQFSLPIEGYPTL
jgi:hypothetical protein